MGIDLLPSGDLIHIAVEIRHAELVNNGSKWAVCKLWNFRKVVGGWLFVF
jgi:hypothetical protein